MIVYLIVGALVWSAWSTLSLSFRVLRAEKRVAFLIVQEHKKHVKDNDAFRGCPLCADYFRERE